MKWNRESGECFTHGAYTITLVGSRWVLTHDNKFVWDYETLAGAKKGCVRHQRAHA